MIFNGFNPLFVLLVALFAFQNAAPAQDAVEYVPSSAFMAIDARPKAAMAQPSMELLPKELIRVFGQKELGIDLLEVTRLTALVEEISDPQMSSPPGFGVVIHFASPQKLSEQFLEQFERTTFETYPAYRLPEGEITPVLVLKDEKTMILGADTFVKKMLNARGASSKLITQMKSAPASDHLNAYLMVEPIRAVIKQNLPPREQIPPPFRRFLELPDLVDSITYRSNFSMDEVTELTITATDEAAVEQIRQIIRHGIDLAKTTALSAMAADMEISDPDYQQAIMDYADRVANVLKAGLMSEAEGARLVYDLTEQKGYGASSVATVGVLVGMLLPAVQQVREAARRTTAANNLRQLALATHNYESVYQHFPMQASYDENGRPLLSWRVHLLPYLEQQKLYEQFKLDEPWDSPHNIKLLDTIPSIYLSPNQQGQPTKTVFLAVSGEGTVFPGNQKIRFANIVDGSSNTVMFVEADQEMAVPWTKPSDWEMNPNDPMRGLGNLRPSGFNAAFCDGSVRFIERSIDPEVWKFLTLIADGNIVDY